MRPPPARRQPGPSPTAARILDVAERLAQTRGFNGFSYADIAGELAMTKANLHYHFPSKSALGQALIERYSAAFGAALDGIEQSGDGPPAQLARYVAIYQQVLKSGRICLCGMLAAEYTTLPEGMQRAIRAFFDLNERWLIRVLEAGRAAGTLQFEGPTQVAAHGVTSALEGAMLLARPYGGGTRFQAAADRLLKEFAPKAGVVRSAGQATTRRSRSASQPRAMR